MISLPCPPIHTHPPPSPNTAFRCMPLTKGASANHMARSEPRPAPDLVCALCALCASQPVDYARLLNKNTAFRRLFQKLPEMGPRGWSSGLCSQEICARRFFFFRRHHLTCPCKEAARIQMRVGYSHATRRAWLSPPDGPQCSVGRKTVSRLLLLLLSKGAGQGESGMTAHHTVELLSLA